VPFWRRKKQQTIQCVFVFVPYGAEEHARVVMPDYFTPGLFRVRDDRRLSDEEAVEKAKELIRRFVIKVDDSKCILNFLAPFKTSGTMPLGVGLYRPVVIKLSESDSLKKHILLQPLEKVGAGQHIRAHITPIEKTRLAERFPEEVKAYQERVASK